MIANNALTTNTKLSMSFKAACGGSDI